MKYFISLILKYGSKAGFIFVLTLLALSCGRKTPPVPYASQVAPLLSPENFRVFFRAEAGMVLQWSLPPKNTKIQDKYLIERILIDPECFSCKPLSERFIEVSSTLETVSEKYHPSKILADDRGIELHFQNYLMQYFERFAIVRENESGNSNIKISPSPILGIYPSPPKIKIFLGENSKKWIDLTSPLPVILIEEKILLGPPKPTPKFHVWLYKTGEIFPFVQYSPTDFPVDLTFSTTSIYARFVDKNGNQSAPSNLLNIP